MTRDEVAEVAREWASKNPGFRFLIEGPNSNGWVIRVERDNRIEMLSPVSISPSIPPDEEK